MKIDSKLLPLFAAIAIFIAIETIIKFYNSPDVWHLNQTSSYSLGYSIGQIIGMPLKAVIFGFLAVKLIKKYYSTAINKL